VRILAVTVVLLISACAAAPRGGDTASQNEIADATARWVAAYNSREPARITAMYEPDAVLWGTGAPDISPTPAAIADYFKDAAKRPKARVEIVEQHIRVLGDVAFNAGRYVFTNYKGDKAVQSPSRFTFVFHKRSGEWRIVHHHSSRAFAR
jgi:uncharacterized protein (TIGR02246 family)